MGGDHHHLRLVPGHLLGVQLAFQQVLGEEVPTPSGQVPGQGVLVLVQVDQGDLGRPPSSASRYSRRSAEQVITADSPAAIRSSIQAPMACSHGQRSASVSGSPRCILAMAAAVWNVSASANVQPSRSARPVPIVVLPLPDGPAIITITRRTLPAAPRQATVQGTVPDAYATLAAAGQDVLPPRQPGGPAELRGRRAACGAAAGAAGARRAFPAVAG